MVESKSGPAAKINKKETVPSILHTTLHSNVSGKYLKLDVWESMLPFFEMGGMGKGTGRGIGGTDRGMSSWVD